MKPICLVVQMIYDIDVRVRRKAEALVAAGYSVDVLAIRATDGLKRYSLNGVNVRTISLAKERGSLTRYLFEYTFFFCWAFIRLTLDAFRRSYAVIEINTLPDFLVFAAALAKLTGAKVVLDMHEITPEFYISKYGMTKNAWSVRLLQLIEKVSMNFADEVLTINKPIEDLLVSRGLRRAKSTIIMNSADETRFAGNWAASTERGANPQEKFVMMYHGTLTNIYGLDIAIEAFALAHAEMPGAEMWILGSGPQKSMLNELAEARGLGSKVRLVGHVSPSEIPSWLSQCDVGILPIRQDIFLDYAFPNKLPEFVTSGKAVLVSRLKTIRYYFSESALAYFEPNQPSDMAVQMVRLYQSPPLREEFRLKAKQEYEPIRWALMRQRYVDLIDKLVGAEAPQTGERIRPKRATIAAK